MMSLKLVDMVHTGESVYYEANSVSQSTIDPLGNSITTTVRGQGLLVMDCILSNE